MPELPDIEIFARNLNRVFAGKKLLKIRIVTGKKLPDKPSAYSKRLNGKKLKQIFRSGKEMRFEFSDTLLGLHLMLTGDLFIFQKQNSHHSTIAEFYFEGSNNLVLTDRMRNANIKLDPVDKAGVDALSKNLNVKYLKQALQRKTTIKKVLTDQDVIRGIGNSYSDEILWQAGISPFSIANAIPEEKIKQLPPIIKKVLKKAIKDIGNNNKDKINVEVKEYLQVHTGKKETSPTGHKIIVKKVGFMKTYYTNEQKLYK